MLRNVCDLILVAVTTLTQTATQLYASNISFPINDMTPTPPQTDTSLQTLLNSTVINSTSPNLNTFQYLPHSPIWQNETFRFFFNPPAINDLLVDSNRTVNFNCSSNNNLRYVNDTGNLYRTKDSLESSNTSVFVLIQARDSRVAKLIDVNADNDVEKKKRTNSGDYLPSSTETLVKPIIPNTENNFTVLAMHIGYATMSVTLIDANSLEMAKNGIYRALSQADYQITVKRAEKLADFVFNCSAAAVAILISFGIGCVTDTESLKKQLKYPMSLVVGFCCQFLILPMLAFGIAKMLPLDNDVRFGLLCVACVPGGGLGHVAVILGQADIPLSLAMNLISIVAMLGTAPLWIFVLGQHFYNHHGYKIIPIYNFEIWLASTFFAYTAGLVINRFKPNVADALLTWIIKPLMLLAAILYITLGVYINMYVFEVINEYAVLAAFLLPLCGFTVAFVIGKIFRQKDDFCKSMALETSSLNVLIVIAAIRFSLTKTSADLASVVPLWVMFTIPAIYVLLIILNFLKGCVMNFLESRKQQQFRHFSIASGIVNQANIAALSAPLFVTEITDDDQGSISEKITVL